MQSRLLINGIAFAGLASLAHAQTDPTLTLDEAVRLAMQRNGTVQSVQSQLTASKFNLKAAGAAYLPKVTGNLTYTNEQLKYFTGPNRAFGNVYTNTAAPGISTAYNLLDSGAKSTNYGFAKENYEIQKANTVSSIRNVILTVNTEYYGLLRAQELLKVDLDQQKRYDEVLKSVKAKFDVGFGPKKDILQAEADALNAKSNVLVQQNQVNTAWQTLRATIGWDGEDTPKLAATDQVPVRPENFSMDAAYREGLKNRPDLQSLRASVESARLDQKLAEMDSRVTFSLDWASQNAFGPDVFRNMGIVFTASVPLYDGQRSRSVAKAKSAILDSQKSALVQQEREVRADIESAYRTWDQQYAILDAAKAALAAAQENYRVAEFGARPDVGKSTLLEIRNAQVTLSTAEVNYVQALYDMLIADTRYRVAVGRPLDGENLTH